MIYYRKKSISRIAEVWYNFDEKPSKKADVLRYKFVSEKPKRASSFEELYTLLLDLEESEEVLFARIRKNTRYEINRAKNKDKINCITFLQEDEKNEDKLMQYIAFFNAFANSKGRSHVFFSDIESFYDSGTFCIRYVETEDDILTMHAYVVSDNTARLYQSSSLFRTSDDAEYRAMIGRANRLLHWDDMIYFKAMGLKWYDFGGWYGGSASTGTYKEQLLINQFKESFGGIKKQEYSFILPATFRGKIAVWSHSTIKLLRKCIKSLKHE
jgi:lipid II:glycine glycyltransferase (peptidoglycan interpeptide bridge formation enzyme)